MKRFIPSPLQKSIDGLQNSPRGIGNRNYESVRAVKLDTEGQRSVMDMKEELESQWRNLIEKMHKTELEDLKSTLLHEMHVRRMHLV